jgi:hypothetical protein
MCGRILESGKKYSVLRKSGCTEKLLKEVLERKLNTVTWVPI